MSETARLVLAIDSRQVTGGQRELDRLGSQAARTEKDVTRATDQMGAGFGALKVAIAAVAAGLTLNKIADYADAWVDLNARVRLAIGPMDDAGDIMDRLDSIARRSYSSLQNTSEAYLLNSRSLRELGFSTQDALDFTESLSLALVVSGAKAQKAEAVTDALSKAIAAGTLSGVNFNTVIQQGGVVAEALADGLGVTLIELRAMASEGKLTTSRIIPALISQLGKLTDQGESMEGTIGDGWQRMNDSAMRFFGTLAQESGVYAVAAGGLISIADGLKRASEDTDVLITALEYLAALAAGRVTSSLLALTAEKYKSVAASLAAAKAEASMAAQVVRRTEAELIAARQIQARAMADAKATAGTNAHAFAMEHLTTATARATQAQAAHAAATNAASVAAGRASIAARAAGGAMALLGGPAGAVTTAVLALGLFISNASDSADEAGKLDAEIKALAGSFDKLSVAQAKQKMADFAEPYENLQEEARRAYDDVLALQRQMESHPDSSEMEKWSARLITLQARFDDVSDRADEYQKTFRKLNEIIEGGDSPRKIIDPVDPAAAKRIRERIKALELEARAYGKTSVEAQLYRLELEKATSPQLAQASKALYTIAANDLGDSLRSQRDEIKRDHDLRMELIKGGLKQEGKEQKRWNDLKIQEEERYRRELQDLQNQQVSGFAVDSRSRVDEDFRIDLQKLERDYADALVGEDAYLAKRTALKVSYNASVAEMDLDEDARIQDRYAVKLDQEQAYHEDRRAYLVSQHEQRLLDEEEFNERILAENARYEEARTDLQRKEQLARNQLMSNMLTQMSGMMSSKYRALFEIGKAAALSNIAVRAPEMAHDAAAWGMKLGGPPLSAAFRVASYLVSAAQAAEVGTTSFGGGSGGGGGGGGISGGVQTVPAAPAPVQLDGGGGGGGIQITFSGPVNGLDESQLAQTVADAIKERIDTTDYVLVESTSRNGRQLSGR